MAEIFFYKYLFIVVILMLQLEFFFFFCYDYIHAFIKVIKMNKYSNNKDVITYKSYNKLTLMFILPALLFLKFPTKILFLLLLFNFLIFYVLLNVILMFCTETSINRTKITLVLSLFFSYLIFLFYINSFLVFFFFIEIYGVLYYFIFLSSYSFTNQTLLKYKNSLILLLWNNFLTTVLLAFSCLFLYKTYGTTSFYELSILTKNSYIIYFFLVAIAWKLGLPLFHFFKLEIYKYLLKENVFLFSVLTVLVNLFILFYFLSIDIVYYSIYTNNFFIIILIFLIHLLIFNLKLQSLLLFLAISGLITTTTILVIFII